MTRLIHAASGHVRSVLSLVPVVVPMLGLAAVIGVAGTLGGCVRNEVIGRSQLIGISQQQEIALGAQAQPQLISEMGGKVPDAEANNYVIEVGRALAATTEGQNPQLPWEFSFINSNDINAFALPGGKVFITRGLVSKMTSEAQLASVLGHEVGHVTARHTAERIGQAQMAQVGMQIGGSLLGNASATVQELGGIALQIGGAAIPLKFSRDQEIEADLLGMRYMVRAGYNPRGALEVMQILAEASGGRGGGGLGSLLATHPDPQARAERIVQELNGQYRQYTNSPNHRTGEDRFAQRMRSRLALLPEAPHGVRRAAIVRADATSTHNAQSQGYVSADAWATHLSWCGTCRADAPTLAFAGY
ncbi:MAG: M48 family metalloprotease [Phycisphaerales bacterium]|jgi:predicted Zn-dependent protease|nr:M48 family metalloprotease [Phycisphaerales bacterium]